MLYYILFNHDLTAEQAVIHFLITIFVYLVSLTIHEFAHAFSAYKLGDPTAKVAGRMTLNPFKHLDLMGFIFFMLLGFGWAKPVPIDTSKFKKVKRDVRIVSSAGILVNLLMGLLSAGICAVLISTVGFGIAALDYVYSLLFYFMMVNSFLAMFNLLPIMPLDGFNIVASFARPGNKFVNFMAKNGTRILFGILLLSIITDVLFGVDILSIYMSLLYDYVFIPISFIGL